MNRATLATWAPRGGLSRSSSTTAAVQRHWTCGEVQPRHLMIEVAVVGLGIVAPGSDPLLLLKEYSGDRLLPIGIGQLEAYAIAVPLQGLRPPRPLTHDVFTTVIAGLGGHVRHVEIRDLIDDTF